MPNYIQQKTLGGSMEFSGVALHTGKETSVRVLPGAPDTGYRFRMTGNDGCVEVEASVHNINDTLLATSLGANGTSVKTVEHLLSALAGSGVDNAVIETFGDEIPIMDGSAAPFVRGIEMVGVVEQDVPKKMLRILDRIEAGENGCSASFEPSDSFRVSFVIDFDHPAVGRQEADFHYSPEAFRGEIAYARTFGFLKDVQAMIDNGLALGASLENAVAIGDDKVVNPGGLRSPDEFVRHKILDTIGDLSLLGIPIIGAYNGFKAGHRINRLLMQEVLKSPDRWELVMVEEDENGHSRYQEIDPRDVQSIACAL
ncbi:MAG: UDP-3-O-acyl-N-acetylglucosamine deacetylase [bacterium]|nr:UDP-3-O-acyl-N-acetylglucosamine deacetylase [bacterium]MDT8396196.1 UDP-3-O-acyl-N-acetylglucosamine deacetylase [bacterium]